MSQVLLSTALVGLQIEIGSRIWKKESLVLIVPSGF
jgi:hypothetical protein